MPSLACLVCGRLSDQSRCRLHRTNSARGYGSEHRLRRARLIAAAPWCSLCFHQADPLTGHCGYMACTRCPLELDHVIPMNGKALDQGRYQILCRRCNRAKSNH